MAVFKKAGFKKVVLAIRASCKKKKRVDSMINALQLPNLMDMFKLKKGQRDIEIADNSIIQALRAKGRSNLYLAMLTACIKPKSSRKIKKVEELSRTRLYRSL